MSLLRSFWIGGTRGMHTMTRLTSGAFLRTPGLMMAIDMVQAKLSARFLSTFVHLCSCHCTLCYAAVAQSSGRSCLRHGFNVFMKNFVTQLRNWLSSCIFIVCTCLLWGTIKTLNVWIVVDAMSHIVSAIIVKKQYTWALKYYIT